MKINNNVSAVITNKQLLGTENNLAASMERLSSGLKINHASDNPSGMAIAGKMRAQIKGLDQASRNSSDGTSVIQTVDGALGEVTSMLQRMRELAIQAANGTNSPTEKQSCQLEIASLRDEIDRISGTTEFNTKSLLDGSLDARVYVDKANVNNVSRIAVSDAVSPDKYEVEVTQAATQAEYTMTGVTSADLVGKDGSLSINGSEVTITKDMTQQEIFTALRDAAEYGECVLTEDATGLKLTSTKYGAHAEISLRQNSKDGIFGADIPNAANNPDVDAKVFGPGKDPEVSLASGFSATATANYDGNKVTITDKGGFEMSFLLKEGVTATGADALKLDVTEIGIMDLQVGANEGQTMQIRIPATDVKSLYIDDINVATVNGALTALGKLDDALTKISEIRSTIGAYENRLDYTVNSLDETEENMTAALSRIEDVDMAEEMVEYTKNNVLEQAGTSALTQANSLPELALQILGS